MSQLMMFVGALKGIAPVLVAVLVTSAIAKAGRQVKGMVNVMRS